MSVILRWTTVRRSASCLPRRSIERWAGILSPRESRRLRERNRSEKRPLRAGGAAASFGGRRHDARTVARNLSTSVRTCSDWRERSDAEDRTWVAAAAGSPAERVNPEMLVESPPVPRDACWTLRAISLVAAPWLFDRRGDRCRDS